MGEDDRRKALIKAMEPGLGDKAIHREHTQGAKYLDRLLAHLEASGDDGDRALGEGLEKGLEQVGIRFDNDPGCISEETLKAHMPFATPPETKIEPHYRIKQSEGE